jgi:hypothetical protein
LFAHGRWFSPGTLAFSTTKTDRHDITDILLNVTLNTNIQKSIKIVSSDESQIKEVSIDLFEHFDFSPENF